VRIAHIIPSLERGGAERVVVTLANEAARTNHDVTVITAGRNDDCALARELAPDVRHLSMSAGPTGRLSKYVRLVPFLLQQRALLRSMDIVHVHLLFGTAVGTILWTVGGDSGPKIVETFHAAGMPLAAWKRRMTAINAHCRDAFVLMAEDPLLVDAIGAEHGSRVRIIPNGIDVPDSASEGEREALKRRLGVPASSPLIGTVGRMVAEREPEKMLRLFDYLQRQVPDAHFVIGGDGPLLSSVRAMARDMGLLSRLHLPGAVSKPLEQMKACDLYISINVGPLTGIAGLEAAATGTPVIALQARRDYQADSDDWIWSDFDPEQVAGRAVQLLDRPEERLSLGEAQRQGLIDRYSAEAMSEAYLHLYSELLAGRTGMPSNAR
jgi:glycosyltransferase involved in cell wall biosynthesis